VTLCSATLRRLASGRVVLPVNRDLARRAGPTTGRPARISATTGAGRGARATTGWTCLGAGPWSRTSSSGATGACSW
jgi:hypothetical protein